MPAQDFAGRTVADHVEAFTSGKVAARDIARFESRAITKAKLAVLAIEAKAKSIPKS